MDLWLRCFTQDEAAEAVGMADGAGQKQVSRLLDGIRNYEICLIPGIFTENAPDESATQVVKDEWEEERKAKILEHNKTNAEHATDFQVPVYNVWKQQTESGKRNAPGRMTPGGVPPGRLCHALHFAS